MILDRAAAEPPILGQIRPYYHDGLVTIFHGDCRQIAPLLPQCDVLLTDPPYGIGVCPRGTIGSDPTLRSRRRHRIRARCTRFRPVTWDSAPPDPWVLEMLVSRARWAILWGGNYYPRMPRASCWLVWDKRVPVGVGWADAELAWTNLRRAVRLFRWRWSGMLQEDMRNKERRVHPTQKPVPLMEWCLSKVPGVRSVLDPYMGSGSTLVAAQRLGIRAVGIEQDEGYCAAAVERIREDRASRFCTGDVGSDGAAAVRQESCTTVAAVRQMGRRRRRGDGFACRRSPPPAGSDRR